MSVRTWAASGSLGILVGLITGMSATSVTTGLIGFLFAFAGGSAIAFRDKLKAEDRSEAEYAVLALSLGCVIGIVGGILISEFRLLSPEFWCPSKSQNSRKVATREAAVGDDKSRKNEPEDRPGKRKYLKADEIVGRAKSLDQLLREKKYTPEQAYKELRDAVLDGTSPSDAESK